MRPASFWTAVLLCAAAVVGGGGYALATYRGGSGPQDAVTGYFAAIARADAPAALAYGTVPSGPRDFLTSAVLAEQQRIAPLHDVRVTGVSSAGSRASVRFAYRLDFAAGGRDVSGTIQVLRRGGNWRLADTAVRTTVRIGQASDRLAFAGTAVPDGATLLFPGALPVRFDTPYLRLAASGADVRFGGGDTTEATVIPSTVARSRLAAELGQQLAACVAGPPPSADCPLPSSRYVPGSLHGRIVGDVGKQVSWRVSSDAAGSIEASGSVVFSGRYTRLSYDNVPETKRGRVRLPVTAGGFAVAPLTIRFAVAT